MFWLDLINYLECILVTAGTTKIDVKFHFLKIIGSWYSKLNYKWTPISVHLLINARYHLRKHWRKCFLCECGTTLGMATYLCLKYRSLLLVTVVKSIYWNFLLVLRRYVKCKLHTVLKYFNWRLHGKCELSWSGLIFVVLGSQHMHNILGVTTKGRT